MESYTSYLETVPLDIREEWRRIITDRTRASIFADGLLEPRYETGSEQNERTIPQINTTPYEYSIDQLLFDSKLDEYKLASTIPYVIPFNAVLEKAYGKSSAIVETMDMSGDDIRALAEKVKNTNLVTVV